MREIKVYIVHGLNASPNDHWFPWLENQLELQGVDTTVLAMPSAHNPDPVVWQEFLKKNISLDAEEIIFVAHSLGCIVLLNYITRLENIHRIKSLILVSGFSERLPVLPQLDIFLQAPFNTSNADKIAQLIPNRLMIASRNDSYVPFELSKNLSDKLQADFHAIDEGGHFLASDGFQSFPLIYEEILKVY